jgi:hypothetical protein
LATITRLGFCILFAGVISGSGATASESGGCVAEGRKHPEGARIEAHRVTGLRTRTAVPVFVECRGGTWIWPGTGMPVVVKQGKWNERRHGRAALVLQWSGNEG